MNCLILALLVASAVAMDHNELVKFTEGFLTEMKVTEDMSKLMKCLNDAWGKEWDSVESLMKTINWGNVEDALKFITKVYLETAAVVLSKFAPCSGGEVQELLKKIEVLKKDERKYLQKIIAILKELATTFKAFAAAYDAKDYNEAGTAGGEVMNMIFFN